MRLVKWKKFPGSRPQESGVYVVNSRIKNIISNVLAFYDCNCHLWFDPNDKGKVIDGIDAYHPERIIPME